MTEQSNNHPEISIVVINYNTHDLTIRCIQSIIDQTKQNSYEIIVVDNASTKDNPDDFKKLFPEIILIKSEQNLGFAKGNNLGIGKATGNHILLLNSDAFLLNDVLKIATDFLDQHPRVATVTGRLEFADGKAQHNCQRFPSIRAKLFELLRLQKIFGGIAGRVLFGSFFDYDTVAYPDWVWGTCFMFRRTLLNELPSRKLADDFFMYGEDMQWCKDIRSLGHEIAFLPQSRVLHLMGASGGKKDEMMEAHLKQFMQKNYSRLHRQVIRLLNFLLTGRYGY